jgi:hypothetical protein
MTLNGKQFRLSKQSRRLPSLESSYNSRHNITVKKPFDGLTGPSKITSRNLPLETGRQKEEG